MEKGLSKIINVIKSFATAHPQIEAFVSKPLTEYVAQNDRKYPILWLDYSSISPSAQRGQWVISMPFYFFDRVERDYSNLDTVMSSQLFTADDFLTKFNDNSCEYGFDFQDNSSVTAWILDFEDIVCGWQVTVSVQTGMARNENKIPT